MRKLFLVLWLLLMLTVVGCSSMQGYQGEIDEACTQMHNICGAINVLCEEGLVDSKHPENCSAFFKGCSSVDWSCEALR